MASGDSKSDAKKTALSSGLLPAGLQDVLYPNAENDAKASEIIMNCLASFGYRRVQPPLVEFEDSLLSDKLGAALSDKTFRLLDPLSHKMMALRADMTAQIARISGTRLAHSPRPLRLSYAGAVMRVVPDVLNPERQMMQAGAELIGASDALACAEMISLGVRALNEAGIEGLTVDIGIPHLFDVLVDSDEDSALYQSLAQAISERDSDALLAIEHKSAPLLNRLLLAAGQNVEELMTVCQDMTGEALQLTQTILSVVEMLHQIWPDLPITLDLLDRREGDYHKGLNFALYGKGLRGEIARGGAYVTGFGEEATGLSIYMERVLRALPAAPNTPRIYVSAKAGLMTAMALVSRGRDVVMGSADCDEDSEAKALGCEFIVREKEGMPEALSSDKA